MKVTNRVKITLKEEEGRRGKREEVGRKRGSIIASTARVLQLSSVPGEQRSIFLVDTGR